MRTCSLFALLLCCGLAFAQGFDEDNPQSSLVASYPLNTSGNMDNVAPTPTMAITFDRTVASTYAAEVGGQVFTVNSTPVRVTDGTYPDGLAAGPTGYGWKFDGSDDYLSIADAAWQTPTDFTVCMVATPTALPAGARTWAGKAESTGPQCTWGLYSAGTSLNFYVSKDLQCGGGGSITNVSKNALALNRESFVCAVYDYVADGSSLMALYVDGLAAATSSSALGPPANSTASIGVGAMNFDAAGSESYFTGPIHHFAYFDSALTSTQVATLRNTWLGLLSTKGSDVVVTSTTPPSILLAPANSGVEPFLVPPPPNSEQISSAGIRSVEPITARTDYGSAEVCSGVPSVPTGWASPHQVTCDTTTFAEGSVSLKLDSTGGYSAIANGCKTNDPEGTHTAMFWAKSATATAMDLYFRCYTSANCTTGVTDAAHSVSVSSSWAKKRVPHACAAGTLSWRVQFENDTSDQVIYADALQVLNGDVDVDAFCGTSAAADAVCTSVLPFTTSVIGLGPTTVTGTFSITYDPTVTQGKLWSDGVFNAANTWTGYVSNMSEPGLWSSDSAGVGAYVAPNISDMTANTEYALKWRWSGSAADLGVYWQSAWRETVSGTGTGIRSATQTTFSICSDGNGNAKSCAAHDLVIYRRKLP